MSHDNSSTDKSQPGHGPRRTVRDWLQSFFAHRGISDDTVLDATGVQELAAGLDQDARQRAQAHATARRLLMSHLLPNEALELIRKLGDGQDVHYVCYLEGAEDLIAIKLLQAACDPRVADDVVVKGEVVRIWSHTTIQGVRQYTTYHIDIESGSVERLLDDDERLQGLDLSDPNPPASAADEEDEWP